MKPLRAIIDFWSRPVRSEPLAAFRISIGLIVLLDTLISLLPDAAYWYGPEGIMDPAVFGYSIEDSWRWAVFGPDHGLTTVYVLLGVQAALALCLMLGLGTRLAAAGVWALLISFHARNPHILNAGDILLRIGAFYLMLAPAAASWSLDNLWLRRVGITRDGWIAPWSVRLIQIQICILYTFTGIEKCMGFNLAEFQRSGAMGDWPSGWAVHKTLAHALIARWPWFNDIPIWVSAPMTWATLAWEVTWPALVLWRRTRYAALAFGVLLHGGIFLTMEVTHFSFTTLSFYWLFIPAAVLADMAGKATGEVARRKYTVFYDGMCPICKRARRNLERFDWLGRLQFADIHDRTRAEADLPDVSYADMLRQMYVKRPDGRYFGGFEAFRAIAPVLPISWLLVPFLWLPGAGFFGRRIYKFIARNRFRYAKCDDEFCSMHLKLLAGKELDDEIVRQVVELHEKRRAALERAGKATA